MAESRLTENAKLALGSILATAAIAFFGWAVKIGGDLAQSIGNLEKTVAVLTQQVEDMPREVSLHIDRLDDRIDNLEDDVDRLEKAHSNFVRR